MEEQQFWEMVKSFNWPYDDCDVAKARAMRTYTQDQIRAFDQEFGKKRNCIGQALNHWEQKRGVDYFLGSDGFSDLTCHIVGLGKEVYEASLEDTSLIVKRAESGNYVESFTYAIPCYGTMLDFDAWYRAHGYDMLPKTKRQFDEYQERGWLEGELVSRLGRGVKLPKTFEELEALLKQKHFFARLGDWKLINRKYWSHIGETMVYLMQPFLNHKKVDPLHASSFINLHFYAHRFTRFFEMLADRDFESAAHDRTSADALHDWWWLYRVVETGHPVGAPSDLLPMASWKHMGENCINDFRRYMADLPAFACRHHYNQIVKEQSQ